MLFFIFSHETAKNHDPAAEQNTCFFCLEAKKAEKVFLKQLFAVDFQASEFQLSQHGCMAGNRLTKWEEDDGLLTHGVIPQKAYHSYKLVLVRDLIVAWLTRWTWYFVPSHPLFPNLAAKGQELSPHKRIINYRIDLIHIARAVSEWSQGSVAFSPEIAECVNNLPVATNGHYVARRSVRNTSGKLRHINNDSIVRCIF